MTEQKPLENLGQVKDQFVEVGKGLANLLKRKAGKRIEEVQSVLEEKVAGVVSPARRQSLIDAGLKGARAVGSLAKSAEDLLQKQMGASPKGSSEIDKTKKEEK